MSKPLKVGVKFCGNCNPQISAKKLLKEIKQEIIRADRAVEFLPWDCLDIDLLIVLSACPVDCAKRPDGDLEELNIAGETINRIPCRKEFRSKMVLKHLT